MARPCLGFPPIKCAHVFAPSSRYHQLMVSHWPRVIIIKVLVYCYPQYRRITTAHWPQGLITRRNDWPGFGEREGDWKILRCISHHFREIRRMKTFRTYTRECGGHEANNNWEKFCACVV